MGRDKRPLLGGTPQRDLKTPRREVQDPSIAAQRKPSWRFQAVDLEGPFGWNRATQADVLKVMATLSNYETMTWPEIQQHKSCHATPRNQLCREAQKRLLEIGQDDNDDLYQLRIDGRSRVWGVPDRNILKLLWWDPDHLVYPVEKKHT